MTFTADEHAAMLALQGVGPTVICRLAQPGYRSRVQLAEATTPSRQLAARVGCRCGHSSPQARASFTTMTDLARHHAPR